MSRPDDVAGHYTVSNLESRILAALAAAGKTSDALTVDDLAPVDAFHIRGRAATKELAGWVELGADHRLLDVGCGLGGTSRYLAASFGCSATGIDLTDEYCRVAESLSRRVGLTDTTSIRQGSALALPFEDAHFDIVWTEHVQMNISDKQTFYSEMSRVLKPGGQLAFHDIFAGTAGDVHFPVPWASNASTSHLSHVDDVRALLGSLDLSEVRWENKTDEAIEFFEGVLERTRAGAAHPLGLHILMGENAGEKFTNLLRSLKEHRVAVAQAVMRKNA